MGRFKKTIVDQLGVDKRENGYYSTPEFISKYLTYELLALNPSGEKVLDPATGNEELLKYFFSEGKQIDSFDIEDYGVKRFSNFQKRDFIDYYNEKKSALFFSNSIDLDYDYIIANPPYNCHEIDYIKEHKTQLKSLFGQIGAHNMYSMFLSAIIDISKEGALIGVIISDSFLTATMHSALRSQILRECSIHQLILCPTDLFWDQKADVRTCIMILQKGVQFQKKVKILNRPLNKLDLKNKLETRKFDEVAIEKLILTNKKPLNQFIVDVDSEIIELFEYNKIGDLFQCVTGISTGNDKKYLSEIQKKGFEIPFYKNPGSRKFKTTPDAFLINNFLEESEIVKDFMVRNKSLLFKEGITCSSMGLPFSACYLPENSTFGVNANIFTPKEDIHWMISYLNSSLVTYIVRAVLIRSNMVTSGYISQIPVLSFDPIEKNQLSQIAHEIYNDNIKLDKALSQIDLLVFKKVNFPNHIVLKIKDFALNLNKRV